MMPHPLSVLLAEDTPANQKMITTVLEKRGHLVAVAAHGREALEQAAKTKFDVILMDVQMPVMDGYEAADAIRALERRSDTYTPIIALTAHASDRDREACLEAGMDAHLSKPLDIGALVAMVESMAARAGELATSTGISRAKPGVESGETIANLNATKRRLGNDMDLLKRFIEVFQEDAPQLLQDLRSALAKDDASGVVRAAHSLRGLAANFDASSVVEQASSLEAIAKKNDLAGAPMMLEHLSVAVSQLDRFLQSQHPG